VRRSIIGRKGGFTLMGVGPSLLLWFVLAASPAAAPPPAVFPDQFPLFPTMGNEGASGMAYLKQPWSPFGVSVDEDGRVQYDLRIEVAGLPAVEGESYHVWITAPSLDPIAHLGAIDAEGSAAGATDWHQLMVVISREDAGRTVANGERWSGPIVLRGFSAGARVTPMAQHSLFQQSPM
jgi:hypothetical protein